MRRLLDSLREALRKAVRSRTVWTIAVRLGIWRLVKLGYLPDNTYTETVQSILDGMAIYFRLDAKPEPEEAPPRKIGFGEAC